MPVICGGVRVEAGDLVFGDADGVVVVPQKVEAEVLRFAFDKINGEHNSMRELKAGGVPPRRLREVRDPLTVGRAPTATATSTSGTRSTSSRSITSSSRRVRKGAMAPKADADTLYAEMAGVEKAIVFALRYGDSIGVESNDETTAAAVAKYPDKFVGFAYVDPRRADCMEMLRHAIEDLGLKGAKFGPIYNGVALSDPRMEPVLEYLQRKNLPLTMHMGTTFARNAPVELGRAIHVEPVAMKYPDLTMVLAHMGHPWYEEAIVVSRKQPNVFLSSRRSSTGPGSTTTS